MARIHVLSECPCAIYNRLRWAEEEVKLMGVKSRSSFLLHDHQWLGGRRRFSAFEPLDGIWQYMRLLLLLLLCQTRSLKERCQTSRRPCRMPPLLSAISQLNLYVLLRSNTTVDIWSALLMETGFTRTLLPALGSCEEQAIRGTLDRRKNLATSCSEALFTCCQHQEPWVPTLGVKTWE